MGRDDLHENTADHATDAMIVKIGNLVAYDCTFPSCFDFVLISRRGEGDFLLLRLLRLCSLFTR